LHHAKIIKEETMLKNYLIIAIRNFRKQKVLSLINIVGLSIGLTAVLLIALNIKFEHSFNSFNENESRIFRVGLTLKAEGKVLGNSPEFVDALGPAMLKDMPEVENYVRIATLRTMYFTYGNKSFKIENVTYADSSLFNIFSFNLITGSKSKALIDPYSIVLTHNTATKIFGKENPVGKAVLIGNVSYLISGVVDDPPSNSDIKFNSLISFSTLYNRPDVFLGWNGGNQYITYVLLKKNVSEQQVNRKFPDFLWSYMNKELSVSGWKLEAGLQSLKAIHLYYNDDSVGIRENLNTFSVIAMFILLIACANFVNLSTAHATGRMQEVGMRKILGAQRKSLVKQFLAESLLICMFTLLLALMLVELLMPWYNTFIGKHLVLSKLVDGQFMLFLISILILTGLMAGLYPAFYLSSFRPVNTLKGSMTRVSQRLLLRKALVIFQFAISIVLIVSTFVINDQLRFIRSKNLGFNKKNIVVIPLVNNNIKDMIGSIKTELKRIPNVTGVAASSNVPLDGFNRNGYFPQGYNSAVIINVVDGDDDFLNTFGIELARGRNFGIQTPSDKKAYIINEALSDHLGWTDPIGKEITRNGKHTVIGEVKNFNYSSLYYPIEPLIITNSPESGSFECVSVKFGSGDLSGMMASIGKVWKEFAPMVPFEYRFLDQEFDNVYKADIFFHKEFIVFCWLAIFVALLGLLGLVSYSIDLRKKEIGIRKVLGSSLVGILSLLSREYLIWVIAANFIGWPVGYFVMHRWLDSFAYKTSINLWEFIASAAIVVIIALVTINLQAVKAATANPVKSLKYE
jgi:putative ABC transport system permease protein